MSFEEDETAPVELFIRYILSQPVGLSTTTLCIRPSEQGGSANAAI